jgi:hypothetical protein
MGSLDLNFGSSSPSSPETADINMLVSARIGDVITDPSPAPWLGVPPLLLPSVSYALPRVTIDASTIALAALLVGGQDAVPDELLSDDAYDLQAASAGGDNKREYDIHCREHREAAVAAADHAHQDDIGVVRRDRIQSHLRLSARVASRQSAIDRPFGPSDQNLCGRH